MVIITGMCMHPILGSMDSSLSKTKSLELRAAMQNVAESKMNEIIAKATYEETTPSNQTSVVDYPNSIEPEYHFNVSVEALSGLNIDGTSAIVPLTGAQDNNLRAVSVVVSLQETEPEIANVKLFAMVAKPPTPGDMVYACDPPGKNIFVMNPKTHNLIETLAFTATDTTQLPCHLAVHPNGEWLAIKTQTTIQLMDIKPSSLNRGKLTVVYDSNTDTICGNTNATVDANESTASSRNDRGLVFRPDGKYLYFSMHSPTNIRCLAVPGYSLLPGAVAGRPPRAGRISASGEQTQQIWS